jgi:hypothetical protein
MPDRYQCPRCDKLLMSLGGWKSHLARKHGSFTEEELEAVSKGEGPTDVKERMVDFATGIDGVPVTIDEQGQIHESPPVIPIDQPPFRDTIPNVKKVKATPKQVKKVIAGIPTKILEVLKVTPDKDDRDALEEATDFLQDIFGIEFEIDESKTVIQSRGWAFLWVAAIIGLVWFKHKGIDMIQQQASTIDVEPINTDNV